MQLKTFRVIPLLSIGAAMGFAQVTLNPVPTREIGHPRLLPPFQVDTAAPNLVEGRELFNPAGIALDTSVTPPILYVADTQNNRIMAWQNASSFTNGKPADRIIGQLDQYSTQANGAKNGVARTTAVAGPTGLAVLNGDLFVVDSGNNRVLRFRKPFSVAADQQPIPDLCIGQASLNTKGANAPTGIINNQGIALSANNATFTGAIAFDRANPPNLWLTDPGNNRVLRFRGSDIVNGNSTSFPTADLEIGQLDFISKQPNLPSTDAGRRVKNQLNTPAALAFDAVGRLYVGDSKTDDPTLSSRVMVFLPPFTSGMSASRIMGVFPQQAGPGAPIPTESQIFTVAMANPSAIFFLSGTQGMGVVDSGYHRILLFDPFDQWPDETTTFSPSARTVVGHQSNLNIVTTDGRSLVANDGNKQSTASSFSLPEAAIFNTTSNELFVADTNDNRVLVLPFNNGTFGASVRLLGQDRYDSNAPNLIEGREFNFTAAGAAADAGIALDTTSDTPRMYVADPYNHRVLGYRDLRKLKAGAAADIVIGQPDMSTNVCNYPNGDVNRPTASSLCRPVGLLVDNAGNLYVADSFNGRVLRFPAPFSHTGNQVADVVLGQPDYFTRIIDASNRNMRQPYGLAFAGTNGLLVSDQAHNRVLYFPFTNGTFTSADNGKAATRVFGQPDFFTTTTSAADTGMNNPHHLSADTDGRPYVADFGNGRVLIFDQINNNPAAGAHATTIIPGLNGPSGINVNPNTGEIWIAEVGQNQISRFPKYDTLVFRPGRLDTLPAIAPLSVVQDQYGDIVVGDVTNRVTFYFPGLTAVNGANFDPTQALAPGTFATIQPPKNSTNNFGKEKDQFDVHPNPVPYPKALADVQVLVNDVPAPLTYVSPSQINFVVPWSAPTGGTAELQVVKVSTGQVLAAGTIAMRDVSPGIFNDLGNPGQNHQAAVINNKDGSVNSSTNPALRGDVILIYATGLGPVSETPADGDVPKGLSTVTGNLRVNINGCFLDTCIVLPNEQPGFYLGAALSPQFPGVYQVNIRIPQSTEPSAPVVLLITVNSSASNNIAQTGYRTVVYVK